MGITLYIAGAVIIGLGITVALFVFRGRLHFKDAAEKLTGKKEA